MSFAEDAKTLAEECTEVFGTADVQYSDPSLQTPVTIKASIGNAKRVRRYTDHGMRYVTELPIIVDNSAQILRQDGHFTVGTNVFAIDSLEPRVGERQIANCTQTSQAEVTRKGYRG